MRYKKEIFTLTLIVFCFINMANAQISIREIKAIYKSKIDGRIISEKEFQTFKGTHIFHKIVKGEKGRRDTIYITPPKVNIVNVKKTQFKSQIGKKASTFSAMDIYGNQVSYSKLKGKVIVINFWFVACPPCILEMPGLNKLVASYEGRKDIAFIGFALDSETNLGRFLSHTDFDYQIIPNSKKIARQFKVPGYPSNIIIDKKGVIQYLNVGIEEETIDKSIDNLKNTIDKLIK